MTNATFEEPRPQAHDHPHPDTTSRSITKLDGRWLFRPDPKRLGEHYPAQLHYTHAHDARWCAADAATPEWTTIAVPGSWTAQGIRDLDCAWYRCEFPIVSSSARPRRYMVEFDGADYCADVWFNSHYLGSHEGYLGRFSFDVTDLVLDSNVLVVRVEAPDDVRGEEHEIGQLKWLFKGALGRWDMNDPESKPAGLWGSVKLVATGPVRLEQIVIDGKPARLPPKGDSDAGVRVDARVDIQLSANDPMQAGEAVVVRYRLVPVGFEASEGSGDVVLAPFRGLRTMSIDVGLDDARLWWTWDLGQPRLYDLEVVAFVGGVESDRQVVRTGFRDLRLEKGWDLRLNGVPLFQRGANYLSDLDLASMSASRYRQDVALFRAANMNTVHTFCVVEGDALYEACDAAGLIVYQDLPLWTVCDPSSAVVRSAIQQFDEMIDRHGHHPSIAIWNFGSQPSVANFEKLCSALMRHAQRRDPGRIAHQGNSSIAYEGTEDLHPVRSFFWGEHDAQRFEHDYAWRRDCHMYPGWYFGDIGSIGDVPKSHFEIVTEFGGQSLPRMETLARFLPEVSDDRIPWAALARRCAQSNLLKRHHPNAKTLTELIAQSQAYQAKLLKHHIEFIRAKKNDPCHGLHVFAFNDCWPSVTWSIVEYDRTPKAAFAAVGQAMAPIQVFLVDPLLPVSPGREFQFVIVNDSPKDLRSGTLEMTIGHKQNRLTTTMPIDFVEANGVGKGVGVSWTPDSAAEAALHLKLRFGDFEVTNSYTLLIVP